MDSDMDQEIRENAGDRMQDNISNLEGTKKWGDLENNPDGTSGDQAEETGGQAQSQEFPRASESEVHEAAERAKAHFGGTYDGGGGVESEADEAVAKGDKAGYGSDEAGQQEASSQDTSTEDASESGDELTTGQKFAGILGSDPNMKWESKLADKMSGGDDENASGA